MKNEKNVKYENIGHVLYRKNSRAKNISIRISGVGEVKVTVPRFCSFQTAESFVLKKQDWIKKKRVRVERKIEEKREWEIGTLLSIQEGKIYIDFGAGESPEIVQTGRDYQVLLPSGFQMESDEGQFVIQQMIGAIGKNEAKIVLPEYLYKISSRHNLEYKRVSVRKMKSRWGSCSTENSINLNSALIFLPYELIEYVLLHELVHTIHKNHGRDFWQMLERLMPDAKERRKLLNRQEIIV